MILPRQAPNGTVPRLLGYVDYGLPSDSEQNTSACVILVDKFHQRVPVHKIVIGAAFPIMRRALLTRENIDDPCPAEIYLPDFTMDDIQELIGLLYGRINEPQELDNVLGLWECLIATVANKEFNESEEYGYPDESDDCTRFQDDSSDPMLEVEVKEEREEDYGYGSSGNGIWQVKHEIADDKSNSHPALQLKQNIKGEYMCHFDCDFKDELSKEVVAHMDKEHAEELRAKRAELVKMQKRMKKKKRQMEAYDYDEPRKKASRKMTELQKRLEEDDQNYIREEVRPDGSRTFICKHEGCNFSNRIEKYLKIHLRQAHKSQVCPVCSEFISVVKIDNHLAEEHGQGVKFKCEDCEMGFVEKTRLHQHLAMRHEKGPLTVCDICQRPVAKIESHKVKCKEKMRALGKEKVSKPVRRQGNEFVKYTPHPEDPRFCPIPECTYVGLNPTKTRTHFRESHVKQICPYCNAEVLWASMERHIIMQHKKDEMKFVCTICDERFIQKYLLQTHMDEVHIRENKYVCQKCGKAFFSKVRLDRHISVTHNPKNDIKHICSACGNVYLRAGGLRRHHRKHHPGILFPKSAKPGVIIASDHLAIPINPVDVK